MGDGMAIHLIIGWRCKGKNCGQFHAAKYLGEKDKIEGKVFNFKTPGNALLLRCPKCQEQHLYRIPELKNVELDAPPPPEFQPLL